MSITAHASGGDRTPDPKAFQSSAWHDVQSAHGYKSGAWHQVYQRFTTADHVYDTPGDYNETVPVGAMSVTAYLYGGGADGRPGFDDSFEGGAQSIGGGGGSGARVIYTASVSSGSWGTTVGYHVAADEEASTIGAWGLTAGAGHEGNDVGGPGDNGVGGAGGTASGGNVANNNGNAGANGSDGAAGGAGIDGLGAGGDGAQAGFGSPTSGHSGRVRFIWS